MARSPVKPLWHFEFIAPRDDEEIFSALLERVFGQTPCIYAPAEAPVVRISVYSSRPCPWMQARLLEFKTELESLQRHGFGFPPQTLSISKVKREDWRESWKRHFRVLDIQGKLLIKPSWSKQKPRNNQAVVVLDPGLSFGTGQHPTTVYCLEQLAARRDARSRQSFLDVGTGSGILAIAAARLGYSPVAAFDFDPLAVRIARENARRNRVAQKISLSRQDLLTSKRLPKSRFDVVAANLTWDLLLQSAVWIRDRVKPGGTLLLAGILESQFSAVEKGFKKAGFRLVDARTQNEWRSGSFEPIS